MANITPAEIRKYLTKTYSDEEIRVLCSDHFHDVYDNFTAGTTKGQKIQSLLDYCQRRELIPSLLTVLKDDLPKQFQKYFGLLEPDLSPEPTGKPAPLPPPRPPRWLMLAGIAALPFAIIAVLILMRNPCLVSPRRVSDKDGMTLLCVPPGDFLMGSADTDSDAQDAEKPQRQVKLDTFWIDRTEVTNTMYAECVRQGVCEAPGQSRSATRENYYGGVPYGNYPIIYVRWEDARKYCEWAGRRLPTEAEWEKAARGVDGQIYPWGNQEPDDQRANYKGDVGDTTAVGSYSAGASPYGALDMAGNVWEWTADWYGETYYQNAPAKNPRGPSVGTNRVTRGSSYYWEYGQKEIRATYRGNYDPNNTNNNIGFRCALSP